MYVVQDVTNAVVSTSSLSENSNKVQSSTITPFKKILKQEKQKVAEKSSAKTVSGKEVNSSSSVSAASGGVSSEKAALKSIFERASEKYDISYDFLVAVAKAESDFNTKCVSSAGAKGIMQLMPYECKEFKVTDPYDAEQNIMAAAKLLKAHLDKFNGSFTLAAAAYNAGSGAVKKYGGVPPYSETQTYVKRISKFMAEGVKVPDREVKVSGDFASTGGGGSAGGETKKVNAAAKSDPTVSSSETAASSDTETRFDTGTPATDSDWEQTVITVGTGQDKVTMTYGAYLKYLELGTLGVG